MISFSRVAKDAPIFELDAPRRAKETIDESTAEAILKKSEKECTESF